MKGCIQNLPDREQIINMLTDQYYRKKILNNSHRGDIVEMIVLSALKEEWEFTGTGWHPWDLELHRSGKRFRIQVKQVAALQLWGKTKRFTLKFGWKKKPPDYFFKDHPGEEIESEGFFCDIFIIGLHLEDDLTKADQVDPDQWKFLVIPAKELKPGQDSMNLEIALEKWNPVSWHELNQSVMDIVSVN